MKLPLSIATFLVGCACAHAATVAATANTQAAVQTAINNAASGDTVTIPAGAVSWDTGISIPNTKGITLDGGGVTINRGKATSFLFTIELNSSKPTRITNINIVQATSAKVMNIGFNGSQASFAYPTLRIDHCNFTTTALNVGSVFLEVYFCWPLVDHCTFTGDDASEMIHNFGYFAGNTAGWTQDITPGSAQAMYVEDCVFSKTDLTDSSYSACSAIENYNGSRIVFRHNKLVYCQFDSHGTAGMVGCRWWECYNNTYVVPDASNGGAGSHNQYSMMDMRAGSGVVFNETTIGGSNAGAGYCQLREEDTGQNTGDPGPVFLYQIGRGKNQTSDPAYFWNNTFKTGPVSLTPNSIREGFEFFNRGISRPNYTPYTYPHPLTNPGKPTIATVHMSTSQ